MRFSFALKALAPGLKGSDVAGSLSTISGSLLRSVTFLAMNNIKITVMILRMRSFCVLPTMNFLPVRSSKAISPNPHTSNSGVIYFPSKA
jgi:hypothetical protein